MLFLIFTLLQSLLLRTCLYKKMSPPLPWKRLHLWPSQMQLCLLPKKFFLVKVTLKKKQNSKRWKGRGGGLTRKGSLRLKQQKEWLQSHERTQHSTAMKARKNSDLLSSSMRDLLNPFNLCFEVSDMKTYLKEDALGEAWKRFSN